MFNYGLCVVTTRYSPLKLKAFRQTTAPPDLVSPERAQGHLQIARDFLFLKVREREVGHGDGEGCQFKIRWLLLPLAEVGSKLLKTACLCLLAILGCAHLAWSQTNEPEPLRDWEVTGFLAALKDPSELTRIAALRRLGNLERPFSNVDLVRNVGSALTNKDDRIRGPAIRALILAGATAKEFAPQTAELLKDSDFYVRSSAAYALGQMGAAAREAVPQLVALLKDSNFEARSSAAEALGQIGAAVKEAGPQVVALLKDSDPYVRSSAVEALGQMGTAAKEFAPQIAELLKDPEGEVRSSAVKALGQMGTAANEFAPLIAELLKDPEGEVRSSTVEALGQMGAAGNEFAPQIAELLKYPERDVRRSALKALGQMGAAAKEAVPQIVALLQGSNRIVRSRAAEALGQIGAAVKEAGPQVVALLKDSDPYVRSSAVEGLGQMGTAANEFAPQIAELLKDPEGDVRSSAAYAIGQMGAAAKEFALQVVPLLKDSDHSVRSSAAAALGQMGAAANEFAPQIAKLLKDSDRIVRSDAAWALGQMGAAAKEFAPQIAELLKDSERDMRRSAARALRQMAAGKEMAQQVAALLQHPDSDVRSIAADLLVHWGPMSDTVVLRRMLSACHFDPNTKHDRRVDAYILFAQNAEDALCIVWLGDRASDELPDVSTFTKDQRKSATEANRRILPLESEKAEEFSKLTTEATTHIVMLIRSQVWVADDILWLTSVRTSLTNCGQEYPARAVDDALARIQFWRWAPRIAVVIFIHASVWLILILLYPHFPVVQGLVFRHSWFRKFFGFGYVNLLLTVVPALRRQLFKPFRSSLVPEGALGNFQVATYYDACEVTRGGRRGEPPQPVSKVLQPLNGQRVIEGASGLGKTTLLRHLATSSRRTVALLRAVECRDGVLNAIQVRLQGQARDGEYLRTLIHAGAIDILIDGLNEAPPDTRAKISHFFQESFRGNFVLTTQPLNWDPPPTAQVWELQPLKPAAIEQFLVKQWPLVKTESGINKDEYWESAHEFVAALMNESEAGDEVAKERLNLLCNPMESVLAAELLALGKSPDLGRMLAQFYQIMSEDFQKIHGRDYPLIKFAERVFEWRESGQSYLDVSGFESEVECLVKHKLMRQRTDRLSQKDGTTRDETRWLFRHDKVMDYFLVASLGGEHRERRFTLWHDVRFNGVYDLLAELLPLEEADELQKFLVDQAAETNNSTLANRVTRLLRARERRPQGIAERRFQRGESLLRLAAQKLGTRRFDPARRDALPMEVQLLIEVAENELKESVEIRQKMNDRQQSETRKLLNDLRIGLLPVDFRSDAELIVKTDSPEIAFKMEFRLDGDLQQFNALKFTRILSEITGAGSASIKLTYVEAGSTVVGIESDARTAELILSALKVQAKIEELVAMLNLKAVAWERDGKFYELLVNCSANRVRETVEKPTASIPTNQDIKILERTMAKRNVFLSYCRDNKAEVARLRDDLIAAGETAWWDGEILGGQDWKQQIRRAMKSSYAVVVCLSPELSNRLASGIYPEVIDAVAIYRQQAPGNIFLVPVRLSDCEIPDIEIDDTRTLASLQCIDLFPASNRAEGVAALLKALRASRNHP